MSGKSAVLSYHATKNCFINLPRSWLPKLSKEKLLVFELQTDGGALYTSWAGGISATNSCDTVQINGLFAIKQQLNDGDEVLMSQVPTLPHCSQVFVEPLSITDWEILEASADYIEGHLLEQVRVVWHGQVIPIWVQQSICIFVKIGKIVPNTKCCLLVEDTEVIVTPKARNKQLTKSADKHSALNKTVTDTAMGQHHGDITKSTNHNTKDSDLLENKFAENLKKVATIYDNEPRTATTTVNNIVDEGIQNSMVNRTKSEEPKGVISKTVSYIRTWWAGDNTAGDSQSGVTGTHHYDNEFLQQNFDCKLRVQSLDSTLEQANDESQANGESHANDGTQTFHHTCSLPSDANAKWQQQMLCKWLQQMSCVFISYQTFMNMSRSSNKDPPPRPFLATVTKLMSPVEREEAEAKSVAGRNKFSSKLKTLSDKVQDSNLSRLEAETVKRCVIVRVVVVDDCVASKARLWSLPVGDVLLSHVLCSQLELQNTALIRLTAINHTPEYPKIMSFHPLFSMPSGYTSEMLLTAVTSWIESCSSPRAPCIINQGFVVRIPLKPDLSGSFLVAYPSDNPQSTSYCLLNESTAGSLKMVIEPNLSPRELPRRLQDLVDGTDGQVTLPLPRGSLHQLGGVAEYAKQAMHHIDICLGQRPLIHTIMSHHIGLSNGGLLICGQKGIGKTSLARALCRYAAGSPNMAYVTVVDCKGLKGKRIENLRKLFGKIFQEAIWRQPSVVLLDDLDHVTSAPAGPEQEMSGEAMYYTRVAQVLKDILCTTREGNTKVIVMATSRSRSSVHQSLVSSRGSHYLQEVIEMTSPDQKSRVAILRSILINKPVVSTSCLSDLDLDGLAAKMEGYVAGDITMVVDRTIHAHYMQHINSGAEIKLSLADFQSGLAGFIPAALTNVTLHKAGDSGWTDVGGLNNVRNTLIETLLWPTKYPKLFGSCPLRLRSGLLLYGAPGTGKTLLAGVLAKECHLNFISIKGPELLSKYIGASEQAVRDTFIRAQSAKPCILFFDEFDSLAPRRGHDSTGVTDRVVNQLLTQLDGVEGLEGVYVLGATSRPDLIDPALLRPGRLDKALHCPMPDQADRLEILKALTRTISFDATVDLEYFAVSCEHFTGADFKALLYNAQLEAIHQLTENSAESPSSAEDLLGDSDNKTRENIPLGQQAVAGERCAVLEKEVVHIPSLEEGSVTLTPEKQQHYLNQWEPSGVLPSEDISKPYHSTVIQQSHLVRAFKGMVPSVSARERQKYEIIYKNFLGSRRADFNDQAMKVGQKATLA